MRSSSPRLLRLGARASPLALAQARLAAEALAGKSQTHFSAPPPPPRLIGFRTKGDRQKDKPLSAMGGKEVFTREIEEALLQGAIDLAIHSLKDMPASPPKGLLMTPILARGDPRDALFAPFFSSPDFDSLPKGALLGIAGPRRAAQILFRRPDLRLRLLRGNVETRLRKIRQREAEAALLAMAGLARLGLAREAKPVPVETILPAAGQGALAAEWREDDEAVARLVAPLLSPDAESLEAERAFTSLFGGSCRVPVAAYATERGGALFLRGEVLAHDGTVCHQIAREGPIGAGGGGAALGRAAGEELRRRVGEDFLQSLRQETEFPPQRPSQRPSQKAKP